MSITSSSYQDSVTVQTQPSDSEFCSLEDSEVLCDDIPQEKPVFRTQVSHFRRGLSHPSVPVADADLSRQSSSIAWQSTASCSFSSLPSSDVRNVVDDFESEMALASPRISRHRMCTKPDPLPSSSNMGSQYRLTLPTWPEQDEDLDDCGAYQSVLTDLADIETSTSMGGKTYSSSTSSGCDSARHVRFRQQVAVQLVREVKSMDFDIEVPDEVLSDMPFRA
eukprot:CAMPEP_0206435662 /NCGR_PEP_ID=MMETSP0324_2-20121206/10011_1 /ASSEMBLY_ACC=CAM_ASM_000836 /TAXON_ID=2866 /ORGANISM="Crypthecodinium cohnii, Strain Seligo" /LENGTH=221 /DNA_ID=CAMNT_0053902659 /DNA_START=171 /DNA_END=836 /DNA_ORIENTATION=+